MMRLSTYQYDSLCNGPISCRDPPPPPESDLIVSFVVVVANKTVVEKEI